MKIRWVCLFAVLSIASPAEAQRAAVVRGIGTLSCATFITASQADKPMALQAAQWILGNMTGYFRQVADDPSRTLADDLLVKSVIDVCAKNAEKTLDDAVTIAIQAMPTTEVKKPAEK